MPDDIRTLEARIGIRPWTDQISGTVSIAQLGTLKDWLIAKGMPSNKVNELSFDQLIKSYCIRNYFEVVKGDRPRSLKQIIREGKQFRQKLDVKSVLSQDEVKSIMEDEDEATAPRDWTATPSINNPPSKGTTTQPTQEQELLAQVYKTIDHKLFALKQAITTELKHDQLQDLKSSIENGSLELKLPTVLVEKIISLVNAASEELVFQKLKDAHSQSPARRANTPKGQEEEEEEKKENQEKEDGQDFSLEPEPELPLGLTPKPDKQFIPRIDSNFYFDPWAAKAIRKAMLLGRNLFAEGPTGCGKTALITQVCAILRRGLIRVNPHDGITKEAFLGAMKLKGGETSFQYGALPLAMKNGLVFLLDEADYLTPNLAAVFNPITERGGKLYIPETGETITPSPGFCVFCTANTGGKGDNLGQYTGTEVLNTAWLDRFAFKLRMDYLPKQKEWEMLLARFTGFTGEKNSELDKMLNLATDIRNAFSRGELAVTLSTRKLIDYFEQRENGFSQSEALNLCLLSWLDEDDSTLIKTMLDRLEIELEK